MIDSSKYLGRWYDNNAEPDKRIVNVVNVIEKTREAVLSTGEKVGLIDLDMSGRFDRIGTITEDSEIASQIAAQAPKSKVLESLDRMSNKNKKQTTPTSTTVNENVQNTEQEYIQPSDPVAQFIESSILISKKSGKKTIIPLKIKLELDFDILTIIQTAMNVGASDVEILQHIMRHINITPEQIKKHIAEELCSCPEDADIVNEQREEQFMNTLKEELNKSEELVKQNVENEKTGEPVYGENLED